MREAYLLELGGADLSGDVELLLLGQGLFLLERMRLAR